MWFKINSKMDVAGLKHELGVSDKDMPNRRITMITTFSDLILRAPDLELNIIRPQLWFT